MTFVKCIIKENVSPYTLREYTPLSSMFKSEGVKKPDSVVAKFPTKAKVREGYELKYIQDIVNIDYLKAIYPMQLSCLDERGYDQDPTTDPDETRFVNITSDKYKGYYALDFNTDRATVGDFTTGQGVKINTVDRIDISKQFDIHIMFTPNTTQWNDGSDEPILWGFRDASNGLDIGITGTNGTDSSWRVFLRVDNGSIINGYTGSSELIMTGAPVHIRVKRGGDNLIKAYVNGIEDISQSESASLQPTGTQMTFGDSLQTNTSAYKGYIHEVRFYSGTDLTEAEADKIRYTKPQPNIMKFAGRVWKITNKQTSKTVSCISHSQVITKGKLGDNDLAGATSYTLSSTTFKTILQGAIDELDTGFTVKHKDAFALNITNLSVTSFFGSIKLFGSFLDITTILMSYAETIFYITPRKNIIVELQTGKQTNQVFDQNGAYLKYNITNSENNDTKLVNVVVLTGSGGINSLKKVSVNDIKRTYRKNFIQLNHNTDLDNLSTKIFYDLVGEGGLTNPVAFTKHTISTSQPVTNIRFNHIVNVKRKNGSNVALGATNEDLDVNEVVTQITNEYPSGKTTINTGEHTIDYFEDLKVDSNVREGLIDNTL